MNVPHRSFTAGRGRTPFVNLPVNVGIIKGPDGEITLYDSGWKQLAYIFDWNTSCCWQRSPRADGGASGSTPMTSPGSSSAMGTGITRAS